eukprot:3395712-Pleurochrysis_carterae.AAC.1
MITRIQRCLILIDGFSPVSVYPSARVRNEMFVASDALEEHHILAAASLPALCADVSPGQ